MYSHKKKILIATTLGFATLGVGLGVGLSYTIDHKTIFDKKMNNSITLSNFIDKIGENNFIYYSDFNDSFNLLDNNNKEITDYSHLTIGDAYRENFFKFTVPNKVKFYADKENIDVFIKKYNPSDTLNGMDIYPSDYNSSTPEFKIWFGLGDNETRVEDFITISSAGFYNFKKTPEEIAVLSVSNLFASGIKLKPSFYDGAGKIKQNIFAKNITKSDVISTLPLEKLNNVNWDISSIKQDSKIPSKLIININFSKGVVNENYFSRTYQTFEIDNFPIEQGVDDYKSKVENFIKDQKNFIGLGEAFEFTKQATENAIGTVIQNYEQNNFAFKLPSSFLSNANIAGVEYIFKKWENSTSDSVFPDEKNSTKPKFKIYIRAGVGTPNQYENFVTIEGSGQVTNIAFEDTPNGIMINKLERLSNSGSQNPFNNTALKLIGEFAGLLPTNLTANIVAGVKDPLNNIELTIGDVIVDKETISNIKIKAIKVYENNGLKIDAAISLGTEFKDKALFLKSLSFPGFKDETVYNNEIISLFKTSITANSSASVVNIAKKVEITPANINDVRNKIEYYFAEEIIVGFDSIMVPYKWSDKPTFKIDFNNTVAINNGDSYDIKFKIIISLNSEVNSIEVTRPISSFLASSNI